MLSIQVTAVLDRSRFFLNDVNGRLFTNAVLIEPFKVAYDDLKEELYDYNIAVTSETSKALTINTGITDIGGPTGPALPRDIIVPTRCWERLAGTSDDYSEMGQFRELPKTSMVSNDLMYWSYRNQYIQFIGASTDRDVKIDYIGDTLSLANAPEGVVNLIQAISFLAYRTGSLAADFIGEDADRAQKLGSNATNALDKLLNVQVKNEQSMPVRRRPFMSQYKRNASPMSPR